MFMPAFPPYGTLPTLPPPSQHSRTGSVSGSGSEAVSGGRRSSDASLDSLAGQPGLDDWLSRQASLPHDPVAFAIATRHAAGADADADAGSEAVLQAAFEQLQAAHPQVDPRRLQALFSAQLRQGLLALDRQLDDEAVAQRVASALGRLHDEAGALLPEPDEMPSNRLLSAAEAALYTRLEQVAVQLADAAPLGRVDGLRPGLRQAAIVLARVGIDTPERLDGLLAQAVEHDRHWQLAMGALGQLGYAAGRYLFEGLVAPRLGGGPGAGSALPGAGFWPAFAFGAVAGALAGLGDLLGTAGAQAVADHRLWAPPPPRPGMAAAGAVAGLANFAKNFALRVALATVCLAAFRPEGMPRQTWQRLDLAVDTFGGLFGGLFAAQLRQVFLDSPQAHAQRLLATPQLEQRLARLCHLTPPASALDLPRAFLRGVAGAALAPATPLLALGAAVPAFGLLMAAQDAIAPGTDPARIDPEEQLMRTAVSTAAMALLAAVMAAGDVAAVRLGCAGLRDCLARWCVRPASAASAADADGEMPAGMALRRRRPSAQDRP